MSDIIGLKRGTVKVVDYDLDWPKEFEAVKQRLLKTFGHKIVAIEHIGSTSILGLAAKPIIDIVAVVKSFDNLPQFVDGLQKVDYEYTPERMFDNRKVAIWWHFMPKLEPISSEARKLSPDACASKAGTRPARKTVP